MWPSPKSEEAAGPATGGRGLQCLKDSSASDESYGGIEDAGDGDVEEEEDADLPAPLSLYNIANQLDSLLENFSDLSN